MIHIQSDYSDMFAELDRIESMPNTAMRAGLDAVLEVGFETARAKVHVDTGRLKGSGKKSSKTRKAAAEWEGQFSFPAVNDEGTTYGMYERERGGAHDFFSATYLLKSLFRAALVKGLRRK